MSALTIVYLVAGLAGLALGGEVLVRGATSLARTFAVPTLVIGLTVVSFATSAPELAVTVNAALTGRPGLAVGNVVGSNIANVLLILGICALALPLVVRSQLVRTDIPVMVIFSVLALVLAADGSVGRLDGTLLVVALVVYVAATLVVARRRDKATRDASVDAQWADAGPSEAQSANVLPVDVLPVEVPEVNYRPAISALLIAAGVALLVIGAQLIVQGATEVATTMGVSELAIGLTVVSVGTSLPELAASLVAVVRGERDLAVGNVVGSCLFNIGAVLGVAGVISPGGIPVDAPAIRFDLPIMIAVALALLPVAFTGFTIVRWEGAMFLAFYVAYVAYVLLNAAGHEAVEPLSSVMLSFVIPITGLWLALLVAYEIGVHHGRRGRDGDVG